MTAQETDAQLLWLLRVRDDSLTPPAVRRFVNDTASVVGPDGETYEPYPFSVTLPAQTGDQPPRLNVTVHDVALQVVTYILRSVDDLVADIYAVQRGVTQAESGSKSTWHTSIVSYEDFVVRGASSDEKQVTFQLTMEHYFGEPIGIWAMDADVAPWLY